MKRLLPWLSLALALLLGLALHRTWRGGERRGPKLEAEERVPASVETLAPVESPAEPTARTEVPAVAKAPPLEPAPLDVPASDQARLRLLVLDEEDRTAVPDLSIELLPVFQRGGGILGTSDATGVLELELAPGEYLALQRARPGVGLAALARALDPSKLEVRVPEGDAPQEQTILARRPPGVLEVEVRHTDDRPAEGAVVVFRCVMEDEPLVDQGNRTDANGRVDLGVWNTEAFEHGRLTAMDDVGNVSEPLPISAPFVPGLRRLVLGPAAALTVRVLAPDGAPAADRTVLLVDSHERGARLYRKTGADGTIGFEGLTSGSYRLNVQLPEEGGWERRELELLRGERRELEVVLQAPTLPLAVAGLVLDEEERPLVGAQLAVAVDGEREEKVRTNEQGAFRFHHAAGRRVRVRANVMQQGDRLEPAELEADFGADWLLFRRVEVAQKRSFEVEVYDRVTGAELEHFVTQIDRGPGTERWSDSYAPRRRFELVLLPDARWRVKARDHITAELDLWPALESLEPGERLRIGLDPGLDHTVQVLNLDTDEPIPGVLFRSETAGEARTDDTGRVHLRADRWSVYRLEKEGYQSDDWDPEQSLLWGHGPYYLERE